MKTQKAFGVQSWTVFEAIYWIAYRCELQVGPAVIFPDSLVGRLTSLEVTSALTARASGNPREWNPKLQPSDTPARCYRATVKRWMRETGLNAPDLLIKAQTEFTRYKAEKEAQAKQEEELDAALNQLNGAVQESKLVARGRPCARNREPESSPQRVEIPAHFIDPPRKISAGGRYGISLDDPEWRWLHDDGPFFYDIEVRAEDVRKLWPGLQNVEAEADNEPTIAWQSAEAALEPWFESEERLVSLPEDVQKLIERAMLPYLWQVSSPDRRRNLVRQRVCDRHPGLAQARNAVQQKVEEIQLWEDLKECTPTDVKLKKRTLLTLRKELVDAEAAMQREANNLGLEWPYDEALVPGASIPERTKSTRGRDYRPLDAPLVAEMHALIEARNASSPEDAARAFVSRAAGNGKPESKVVRLALRYRQEYSPKS